MNSFPQTGAGGSNLYFAPTRKGDRGNCTIAGSDVNNGGGTDRKHIANMSGIATIPTFKERQSVELRAEAQNVLNRANFSDPTANMSSNTFGQIIATGPERIMQFALKYSF
jgi:hypothetical protein